MRLIQIHLLSKRAPTVAKINSATQPARLSVIASFNMSEQRISQASSDFSIARILATNSSESSESSNQKKQSKLNQGVSNSLVPSAKGVEQHDQEFIKSERLQSESVQSCFHSVHGVDKEEHDRKFGLLERQLPWLQCTRYSPPKLPRRPTTAKQRKRRLGSHPRIPFTKFQIQVLEEKYQINAYLSRRDVIQLGGILNLPQNRVKIWFQNRRARERKESQSNNVSINSYNSNKVQD